MKLLFFFLRWSSWLFCCLHLSGPKVYKVYFQERQCLTAALLSVRVGVACKQHNYTSFWVQSPPIFMFINVIRVAQAVCLTCLPTMHVHHVFIRGDLCWYVWLANWFHVLWFDLVHVYSEIRFNYVFHATIWIQARSQHLKYNKYCSPN